MASFEERAYESPTRRRWLGAVGGCWFGSSLFRAVHGEDSERSRQEQVARGRRFLKGLFDESLDLLPEYPGAKVYWLYHDNYLAAKVLDPAEPALSTRIRRAITARGATRSGKIEILFGEAENPLPFRRYELKTLETLPNGRTIRTEVVTGEPFRGWAEYADLLLLAAVAEARRDREAAGRHLDAAFAMFDGRGFRDRVVTKANQYATFKLALSVIAARKLDRSPKELPAVVDRLLALQAESGGWVTDYDRNGKPRGLANVETTSLAILALQQA